MRSIGKLVVIGVGLIGGSFALAMKRAGLVSQVVGVGRSAENLQRAIELGVIDQACHDPAEAVQHANLVLVATPVGQMGRVFDAIAPVLPAQAIVSDAGSTKGDVAALMRQHLPKHLGYCVPAHPIAGSDRHGALAAQFGLYQDKKLIICPHAQQDAGALETVETLWQAVGAHTYRMSAATHDAIFAAVSHMPHMLAYAYVHQIAEHPDGQTYLDFAASGFRDFTRIASSHPAIWTDICMANKDSLLDLLAGQQQALAYLQNLLQSNDADALYRYFEEAQHTRDDWQARQ